MHLGHTSPIFHLLYELVLALPDLFFVQVAAVLAEGFQLINVLIHVPHFSYLSEVQFWQLLPVLESPKRLTCAQLLPFSTANINLLVAIALVILLRMNTCLVEVSAVVGFLVAKFIMV